MSILVMKFIINHVSIKKTLENTYFFCAGGGGGTKMSVICQRVVILLKFCADMIHKTLTFHI